MKKTTWLVSSLAACLLVLGGAACSKQGSSKSPQTLEEGLTQMRAALANTSPTVQSNLFNGVDTGLRYGRYTEALGSLDAIANDPSLNDKQKKLVGQVIELLKAKVQAPPKAPGAS